MSENTESRGLIALPDEATFRRDFQAINRFQQIVRASMVDGHDYGVIPGTGTKPTLLKPGAEKIAKLLGLADTYEILHQAEDWDKPFFRYMVKCKLLHIGTGAVISEGLGESNSMESKYRYRWVGERDLPAKIDRSKLVSQERRSKTGGKWTVYRLENEDIYSQVNTLIKMAKKRALVDAALSAGRLSDIFTQDIEDMGKAPEAGIEEATSGNAPEAPKTGMKAPTPTNPIGGPGGGPVLAVPGSSPTLTWGGEADTICTTDPVFVTPDSVAEAILHPQQRDTVWKELDPALANNGHAPRLDSALLMKLARAMNVKGTDIPAALGLTKQDINLWTGTQEQAHHALEAFARLQGYAGPKWRAIKL